MGWWKWGIIFHKFIKLFENKETLLASVGNIKENLSTKAVNKVINSIYLNRNLV